MSTGDIHVRTLAYIYLKTFRTQAAHNVELHTEKSEFFNHASMLARPTDLVTSSFDLSGLGRALTNQEMHTHPKFSQFNAINAPSVPQKSDWAAAFLQEQQKPSIQDHPRENFQLSGTIHITNKYYLSSVSDRNERDTIFFSTFIYLYATATHIQSWRFNSRKSCANNEFR